MLPFHIRREHFGLRGDARHVNHAAFLRGEAQEMRAVAQVVIRLEAGSVRQFVSNHDRSMHPLIVLVKQLVLWPNWGMKTHLIAVAVLLSLAAPLSAQENTPIRDQSLHVAPFVVIATGQSADVLMTMKNFQAGCTEANTGAFGSARPTTARLIGIKVAGVLPAVIVTAFLQKSGHQKAANIIGGLVGGIGFAAAGYNLTVKCGR